MNHVERALLLGMCGIALVTPWLDLGTKAKWVVLGSTVAVAVVFARILALRRLARWPTLTDDEFLKAYGSSAQADANRIVAVRAHIARTIGIPVGRVCLDHTLRHLCESAGRLTGNDLALSDLAAELGENGGDAEGVDWDRITVGEYIDRVLRRVS